MKPFHYTAYAQEIIFENGSLNRLGDASAVYGWTRLMLCTSPSLRRNGILSRIEHILGDRLVVVFAETGAHVQETQLKEALQLAEANQIDALIGLGGGSPIGMAKAVSLHLEARRTGTDIAAARFPTDQPMISTIAVPTTYAGSEMTPVYGLTQTEAGGNPRKVTYRDPKVTPKLVIYDPALTVDLPASVTAATGINALAHCIEAVYSVSRNPVSSAAALLGITTIANSLLRCYRQADDLEARTQMLAGAHLGGQSLATVAMGIHHGTCHVLGGTAGLAHGVANAIILPHAIRFNLDTVAPQIAQAGAAIGLTQTTDESLAAALAEWVEQLVAQMDLPQRLRDAGVSEELLPKLAENMLKSSAVQQNPKALPSPDQALALLRMAW
jgi:alcohol dehydrogenase class IV